jgi:hypothetical protein
MKGRPALLDGEYLKKISFILTRYDRIPGRSTIFILKALSETQQPFLFVRPQDRLRNNTLSMKIAALGAR